MRSFEETGKDGSTSGTGIETGTGGPGGAEGLKEGAMRNGTGGPRSMVEAMMSGTGDTKNMAGIEEI